MRNAFVQELTSLAAQDERIVVIVGDIGFRLWDDFRERFPGRWYNAGIAEQNMVSMAAGLALAGMRPVVYAIASFATYRCLEQIRVDVCYHQLPVVIVGVGGGLSYAALGPTHHTCEDVACMRSLPYMAVVVPCDPVEARWATQAALGWNRPVYLRLGKSGEPVITPPTPAFKIGPPSDLRTGADVCVYASGPIAKICLDAANILAAKGIGAEVVSWHTVKPLAEGRLTFDFDFYRAVAVVEEHSLIGGLGSAIGEWLIDNMPHRAKKLLRFGTPDAFLGCVGDRGQALAHWGLTAEAIAGRIMGAIK